MKILYLVSEPGYRIDAATGYGAHIRGVINAFRKHGNEVLTVVGKERGTETGSEPAVKKPGTAKKLFKRFVPSYMVRDLRQLYLILYDRKLFKRLCRCIDEFKPDVIYERAAYLSRAGVRAGNRYDIPVFLEANSTIELEGKSFFGRSLLFPFGKRNEKYIYRNCTGVIAISTPVKRSIMNSCGVGGGKVTVVPNGIDPENYKPARNRREVRREIGLADEETVVGFVGSLLPWHGVDKLLESAVECFERIPELRFLIVGGEEARLGLRVRRELDEKVRELGITNGVIFTGAVPSTDVPDYIEAMDICAYPGSLEHPNPYGSPIKLFEYGILGKPIICFYSDVIAEMFEDGSDGIFIAPGSVPELTAAILKTASDPVLREKLGNHFRERILADYTWDMIGGRILDLMSGNA